MPSVVRPKVLVLRAAGTNCDGETAYAFELAGATPAFVHINRLLENPALLQDYQILAIPGGFSYGDDIAAGRILANQLSGHLADEMARFVAASKPVIGICNGFQVLVKTALLPGALAGRTGQTCTLTHNDSGRFIARWIAVKSHPSPCIWTAGLDHETPIELPIAHGEGRFVPGSESVRRALWDTGRVVLTYAKADSATASGNPNGSVDDIAGICDETGLIFGLMPHPERHISVFQHPAWTRNRIDLNQTGSGLPIFLNAVRHVSLAVGAGV